MPLEHEELDPLELRTTYRPSRFEADWLTNALGEWFADGTLEDLLYAVRGGKEANVYCCRGGPSVDGRLVAAKVYRPRKHRELSNDAIYREGRALLDGSGKARKGRDRRIRHAVDKGTRAGKRASFTSWVMHEHKALEVLYDAGAAVPCPIAASSDAVLMDFVGDEEGAAPTLDRVELGADEVPAVLDEALRNVEVMLRNGYVHGDLSPYNLLYWQGAPVVIDLPQAVDVLRNPHALDLFVRDVDRVCRGLAGIDGRPHADAIWDRVYGTGGVPLGTIATAPPRAWRYR